MTTETLFTWRAARDAGMAQAERNAGEAFREAARAFVVRYLGEHGPSSGEAITDACKEAEIVPANGDDRSFGPVYMALARQKVIEKAGPAIRTKGHGTAGGNIWQLTPTAPVR